MPNSAYNFVPLAQKVFFPNWSDKVSMDIPFEDGLSGYLELELENQTDIFTRNSDIENDPSFFKLTPEGNYAISGTSIKGVIRNVLEIATFSKIKAVDKRFGVRDLNNNTLYSSKMTKSLGYKTYEPRVKAGWLERNEKEELNIIPCDYARIEQFCIKEYLKKKIEDNNQLNEEEKANKLNFVDNLFLDGKKGFEKTKEYIEIEKKLTHKFNIEEVKEHPHSNGNKLIYKKAYLSNNNQDIDGTLVFSGQCGRKHMEFVFFNSELNNKILINESLYKDFCFIHSDPQDPSQPNKEWDYWKEKMHNGERVPVFYLLDEKNQKIIKSFGLAMMFRLAYKYSIHDAIKHTSQDHFDKKKDFAETLFGYVEENSKDALKGRVCFEPMVCTNNNIQPLGLEITILNSPKPSFYPYYIKQKSNNNETLNEIGSYSTFMDDDCKISGWKRYPIKRNLNIQLQNENNDLTTSFQPLPAHSVFRGKVHFHNIKKCELGALYWALTFGNRNDCFHSIGMAKPYGYGASSIRIVNSNILENINLNETTNNNQLLNDCLKSFIELMTNFDKDWEYTSQIQNLLELSRFRNNEQNLKYLKFDENNRDNNEFITIKGSISQEKPSYYLAPYVSEREVARRKRIHNEQIQQQKETEKQALMNSLSPEEKEIKESYDKIEKYIENKKYTKQDTTFATDFKKIENSCKKIIDDHNNQNTPIKTIINVKEILEKLKTYIKDKRDDKFKSINKMVIKF